MHEITVTYMDGKEETFKNPSQVGLNGPVLMIDLGNDSHVGVVLSHVLKWELKASKIALAGSLPAGLGGRNRCTRSR